MAGANTGNDLSATGSSAGANTGNDLSATGSSAGANTGNDLSATGSSAGANKKKQTINIVVFQHAFLLACVHIYIINELAERILCTLRLRMFQDTLLRVGCT